MASHCLKIQSVFLPLFCKALHDLASAYLPISHSRMPTVLQPNRPPSYFLHIPTSLPSPRSLSLLLRKIFFLWLILSQPLDHLKILLFREVLPAHQSKVVYYTPFPGLITLKLPSFFVINHTPTRTKFVRTEILPTLFTALSSVS